MSYSLLTINLANKSEHIYNYLHYSTNIFLQHIDIVVYVMFLDLWSVNTLMAQPMDSDLLLQPWVHILQPEYLLFIYTLKLKL